MKPMQHIWRMMNYRRGLFLGSCLMCGVLFYTFPLLPGLVIRQIFDTMTGGATAVLDM